MITSPSWIPAVRMNGKEMEVHSVLGPFFRLTAFPESGPEMFGNVSTTAMEQSITSQIRMGTSTAQVRQFHQFHDKF